MRMNVTERRPVGRPPEPVPQDVADAMIEWLTQGKTLTSFCETDGNPSLSTVSDWKKKDPQFAARFACAREIQAARELDETLAIADEADPETVQVAKLRIETRFKRAACFSPGQFGTRVQLGGDGGHPIKVETKGPEIPATADLAAGIAKLAALAAELVADDESDG